MYLRANKRKKDGKEHRYWSVEESRRLRSGRVVQRRVLYLGEINDRQQAAWRKTLEVFDEAEQRAASLSLFTEDRALPADALEGVQVKLKEMELRRPRAFGNYWLGCELWRQLGLSEFWEERLGRGRAEVPWAKVLELLVVSRLVAPGSEFRLHRQGFDQSALGDLLGRGASRWRRRTACIAAWTASASTRQLYSIICGNAGKSCFRRASTCCCTI
jgi:hypothetical protein